MLDTIITPHGQAEPFAPDPKEKARPEATPDRPNENNAHTPAIVNQAATDCKQFVDVQAHFALLGFELRTHCTAPGMVRRILDEDAPPKASKPSGRTTYIVGHWTGPRHVASWHGVIALLASLQAQARG